MTALLLAVALAAPTPVASWEAHWQGRVAESGGLTVDLVEDRRMFYALLEPEPEPAPAVVRSAPRAIAPPTSVEYWRPLVAVYFAAEHVDAALRVMACESHGNPNATHPGSRAAGLFQAMPQWYTGSGWDQPSAFGAFDPYDPESNVRFAAWLFYQSGTWQHWVCRP